ncbi:transcriptional regulator [Thiorhodovibrio winogradskyi]|nr:transcriptional regulator [Thiorhodovibrio winogradskyi]
MLSSMFSVIETPLFSKLWPRYWREEERGAFAAFLAANPLAGDVIPGTNGLRKVRWSRAGSGKSAGVRVIYYTQLENGALILLVLYAKSERGNLSASQLLEIRHAIDRSTTH